MKINKPVVFTFIFLLVAQISLLIIKALKIVDLDWFWVIAPIWVPYVLLIGSLSIAIVYVTAYNVWKGRRHE